LAIKFRVAKIACEGSNILNTALAPITLGGEITGFPAVFRST